MTETPHAVTDHTSSKSYGWAAANPLRADVTDSVYTYDVKAEGNRWPAALHDRISWRANEHNRTASTWSCTQNEQFT